MTFQPAPQARPMSVLFTLQDGTKVLREVKGWLHMVEDVVGDAYGLVVAMVAGAHTLVPAHDLFSINNVAVTDWELVEGTVGSNLDQALAEELLPTREVEDA